MSPQAGKTARPNGQTPKGQTPRPQASEGQPSKARAAGQAGRVPPAAWLRAWYRTFWSKLEGTGTSRNGSTYYLILGSTLALTAIGIMMVLSASSVEAIAAGESPYTAALKQGMFAAIGVFLMFVLSRVNVVWLKRLAWPGIAGAYVLLVLVLLIGTSTNGNRNWIDIGGITFQPSEAAKLALALWMATVLAVKAKLLHRWQHVVVPALPIAGGIIGLVLAGNDLGTGMIIMMIMSAALFFAGVPLHMFGIAALAALGGAGLMAVTSSNRMCRITSWWTGNSCGEGRRAPARLDGGGGTRVRCRQRGSFGRRRAVPYPPPRGCSGVFLMRRPSTRLLLAGAAMAVVLLALIPVGRWEARRHARHELAGIHKVLAAIGAFDQPALDAYRKGVGNPGLDCLLYRRGTNPYALEFCFDGAGRVVEGYDRRGKTPKIWSVREDPSSSDIKIDRPRLEVLLARLQEPA
jgi:hypothetical protein